MFLRVAPLCRRHHGTPIALRLAYPGVLYNCDTGPACRTQTGWLGSKVGYDGEVAFPVGLIATSS